MKKEVNLEVIKLDETVPYILIKKLKYPRLVLLILTFIAAYFIYIEKINIPFFNFIPKIGFIGAFIAGLFFPFGFTAAPATALLLLIAKEQNIIYATISASIGALISNLLIFYFVRISLDNEIKKISKKNIFKIINNSIPRMIRNFIIPVIASFIIASPLPNEIGISLLAFTKNINIRIFIILSLVLNTVGILIILLIGKAI